MKENNKTILIQICAAFIAIISFIFIIILGQSETLQDLILFAGEKVKRGAIDHGFWKREAFSYCTIRFAFLFVALIFFADGVYVSYKYKATIEKSKRLQILTSILISVFSGIFVLLILDNGHRWTGDYPEYIAQARAIVTGTISEQVRNNSFIIKNSPPMYGDAVYPWGFPFILAPFYALFGESQFFLKLPVLLFFAATVFFCFIFFRKYFTFFQAELLTLFIAANPTFIFACNTPVSDMPFLCFSMISILLIDNFFHETDKKKQIYLGIASGFFSFLALTVRSNGMVFPCVFAAVHLLMIASKNTNLQKFRERTNGYKFQKPYLPAHILPYITFFLLIFIQNRLLPKAGQSHMGYLNLISIKSIIYNCFFYCGVFKKFFPFNSSLTGFCYSWLIVFFVIGFVKHSLKLPVLSIYFLGVMGILILWPARQGLRFCYPAIPIMMLFTGLAVRDFLSALNNAKIEKISVFIEFVSLFLCLYFYQAKGLTHKNEYGAYSKEANEMYSFIMENTEENEVIIFFKPRLLYLKTGRLSFQTSKIQDLKKADYLLLEHEADNTFNYDIENQYPDESKSLKKIFENSCLKMYRIEHEDLDEN